MKHAMGQGTHWMPPSLAVIQKWEELHVAIADHTKGLIK